MKRRGGTKKPADGRARRPKRSRQSLRRYDPDQVRWVGAGAGLRPARRPLSPLPRGLPTSLQVDFSMVNDGVKLLYVRALFLPAL